MSQKILIVDDDPNSVALMAYTLEFDGFQVLQAEDGAAALELIEEQSPDLVLLDVMLPDLSGLEVCRRIRDDMQRPELKVVMLSAKADNTDQDRGLQAGADLYLTKPVEPEVVVRSVRELLAAPAA